METTPAATLKKLEDLKAINEKIVESDSQLNNLAKFQNSESVGFLLPGSKLGFERFDVPVSVSQKVITVLTEHYTGEKSKLIAQAETILNVKEYRL